MIKIFNENDRDFSTNGNIALKPLKCVEYKKKSLNGWYIECEIPIKYKDYIEKDKLCVVKTRSKIKPQAFRIGDQIKKTNRKITFSANHVMFDSKDYFLTDVRPENKNGYGALEYVNSNTDKKSPFTIFSNVEHVDTEYFVRKNLLEAWTLIEERWGGVFDADNWDIYFLNKIGNDNGETISYGKNMQNMTVIEDWSGVCTKVYPVGYNELMLPEQFIESDVQYKKPYTRTESFETDLDTTEVEEKDLIIELRKKAIDYLNENKYPKVSYEVTSDINQKMEIGDTIKVQHPLVTITTEVLEYVNDIISDKITSLTFGNYSRSVKSKFDAIKSNIDKIHSITSKQEIAIKSQTDLIKTLNKNGHVYIDDNEILILDKIPKEEAKNVWRFGLAGIGFSDNGYEGPFKTAMTMDGRINADFITTGKLSVNIIEGLAETLDEWSKIMIDNKGINLIVQNMVDLTKTVSGSNPLILEKCIAGNLIEFNIYGDDDENVDKFKNLKLKVYTDNIISTNSNDYSQGYIDDENVLINSIYYIVTINFYEIKNTMYLSCNDNYLIDKIYFYDENKSFVSYEEIGLSNYILNSDNKFFKISFKAKENNALLVKNILKLQPLVSLNNVDTFVENNDKLINLNLDEELRKLNDVKDNYSIKNGIVQIIRRIGINDSGEKYILENEEIEKLDDLNIYLVSGKNYIEAIDCNLDMSAKYVNQNNFTDKFVTEEKVLSSINVAIRDGKGVLEIINNAMIIESDNFKMNKDGTIVITANKDGYYKYSYFDVYLALAHIKGTIKLPDNLVELYRCKSTTPKEITVLDVTTMINIAKGTEEPIKQIQGSFNIDTSNYEKGLTFSLNDVTDNPLQTIIGLYQIYTYLLKCTYLFVGDKYTTDLSEENYGIALDGINKKITITDTDNKVGTVIDSGMVDAYNVMVSSGGQKGHSVHGKGTAHTYMIDWANNNGSLYLTFFVDKAEVPIIKSVKTNAQQITQMRLLTSYVEFIVPGYGAYAINGITQSDEALKKNIKKSKVNGIETINKFKLIEFDWKDDLKATLKKGHEEIGFSANQIKENIGLNIVDEIKQPAESDLKSILQINNDKIVPILVKALQEEDQKVEELRKEIDKYKNIIDLFTTKLNCTEEINEILNRKEKL